VEKVLGKKTEQVFWPLKKPAVPKTKTRLPPVQHSFVTDDAACRFFVLCLSEPVVRRLPLRMRLELFDRLSRLQHEQKFQAVLQSELANLSDEQRAYYNNNSINGKGIGLLYDGPF
jgi:hypothetical protein